MKKILTLISLIVMMKPGMVTATQWHVPADYSTIQAAISASTTHSGDSIMIAAGTYNEFVTVSKGVALIGAGVSTIIKPSSGNGITVTASNVLLQTLRATHAPSNGISASGVSNLSVVGVTADSNSSHGFSIGAGSSNVTVNGGTFNKNGTTRGQGNGGGINLDASTGSAMISNISIFGSVTANNNTTSGVFAYAANAGDSIKTLSIGSSGSATFTNNGGAGVILYGNVENTTVSGSFTKSSANAGGIVIVGNSFDSPAAPMNTIVKKSTFNPGYTSLWPAISLSDLGQSLFGSKTCIYDVSADSILYNTTSLGIDSLIYDHGDDPGLGTVIHTHDNALPVELTNFSASAKGRVVDLVWHTATEVNNYGFEIERRPLPSPPLSGEGNKGWGRIGFVQGMGTTNSPHTYLYKDETSSAGTYAYRLKQIDRDGRFEYSGTVEVATMLNPGDYTLSQNYPNPFNPSTKIRFTLATDDFVQVKVFDILGEEVESLFSGVAKAGVLNVMEFDGSGRSSGVYFYTLTTKNRHDLRKMLLVK